MMCRRWLSLLLAVIMLLSLSITAYADGEGTEAPPPMATEEVPPVQEGMDFTEVEGMEPPAAEVVTQEETEPVATISTFSASTPIIAMPSGGVTMNITGALEGIQEVSYYGTDGTYPAVRAWEVDTFPTQYTGLLPGGQVGFWLKPEYRLTVEGTAVLYDDYFYNFLDSTVTDRKVDLQIPSSGTIKVRIERSGELLPQKIPMVEYGRELDSAWLSANIESGSFGSGWITSGAVMVVQLKSGYTIEVLKGGRVKSVGGYYYPTTETNTIGVTLEVDLAADEFIYAVVKQGENFQLPDETTTAPESETSGMFRDVTEGSWYYSAIEQAYSKGIVKGTSPDTFSPDGLTTRGQAVIMLYRAMGSPAAGGSSFTDVSSGEMANAASWAASCGIVNGVTDTTFAPNSSITREQLVTMLYRMAGSPDSAAAASLTSYTDGSSVQGYATDAVAWATQNGIINGYGDGSIRPSGYATRAEVCTLLMRFVG